jgi:hypothetical protein
MYETIVFDLGLVLYLGPHLDLCYGALKPTIGLYLRPHSPPLYQKQRRNEYCKMMKRRKYCVSSLFSTRSIHDAVFEHRMIQGDILFHSIVFRGHVCIYVAKRVYEEKKQRIKKKENKKKKEMMRRYGGEVIGIIWG